MAAASRQGAAEALRFAREALGPASERVVASPDALALVLSRVRDGAALDDAVLWLVHREGRADPRVADEFIAHFLCDLLSVARPAISPGLRRFLDSGDLVQSVLGDLWSDLATVKFDSRASFLAYLARRLRWKASDHHRTLNRDRRREDLRVPEDASELPLAAADPSPASLAGASDEAEQLTLRIMRLPERDQLIVRLHMRGAGIGGIVQATQLNTETARKALQRALQRLREMR
ncbi:MAG: sigma-70 family RNA polymerase sigma factor [Planctomycetes bacterium]|nr:sigma-70 family RNA polymerase sigma factor [Planctomycetota bacterium]